MYLIENIREKVKRNEVLVGANVVLSDASISELFGLAEDQYLHSVLAFGYPTHKSYVVDPPEDGSLKYYLDDNMDYCVPKLPAEALYTRF